MGVRDEQNASSMKNTNGGEDWGALARRKRDAALEAFVRGEKAPDTPESRQ